MVGKEGLEAGDTAEYSWNERFQWVVGGKGEITVGGEGRQYRIGGERKGGAGGAAVVKDEKKAWKARDSTKEVSERGGSDKKLGENAW